MTAQKTSFQKVIDELLDGTQRPSRRSLQEFSDIDPASITTLMQAWPRIKPDAKRFLLEGLESLSETDTLVSFDDFARTLLNDPDAEVRARAIRLLDECDDQKLIPAFLKILAGDENIDVRAAAGSALGKYVELGELEEIPERTQRLVEDALLEKANSEDNLLVRRNALESLGFSSCPEVVTLIESAFHRENPDWQASALFAMGRSADDRWEELVLSSMMDEFPMVRLAAVEAAGELGLASAGPVLLKVLEDEEDDEIASAAIWSLSQIGGEDVRVYLESLMDLAEDDDQIEFLEDALDNLAFTEDMSKFDLLNSDSDEQLIDIDNEGEE
jgi:HEAT repeat protein